MKKEDFLGFLPFLFPLWLLPACDDEVITPVEPQMVVEGWIEDGEFPVVIVTSTIPLSGESMPMDSLRNYILRWATVSVSNGGDKVFLTGKYDEGYFPPYVYTTTRMRGESGKNYTLEVEYRNMKVRAETSIPERPEVKRVWVEKSNTNDTLFSIKATIVDNPAQKNYYQLFSRVGSRKRQFQAAYMGSIDDDEMEGTASFDVRRPREMALKRKYTPYYFSGDSVAVKISQVDEKSYLFWNDYTKNLNTGGNLFFATSDNIRYNVQGGIGSWCGMASHTEYLVIGK